MLPAHLDDVCIEANVAPDNVHRFLFPETTHEKKVVQCATVRRTDRVELRQFVVFVDVDFLLNEARGGSFLPGSFGIPWA